jgi:hypothetical protein
MNEAIQAGRAPLPVAMAWQIRLTAASEAMHQAAMAINDRAGALLDRPGDGRLVETLMHVSGQLREESDQLASDVGDLIFATPPRRWRGDVPSRAASRPSWA